MLSGGSKVVLREPESDGEGGTVPVGTGGMVIGWQGLATVGIAVEGYETYTGERPVLWLPLSRVRALNTEARNVGLEHGRSRRHPR